MNYKLQDIIKPNDLKKILTKINENFSFVVIIIDNNNKGIATSKWQKIYYTLYQKNKLFLKEYKKSIAQIIEKLNYKVPSTLINKCFQGISYIATPIIIEEKHFGYILAGHFFLKKPVLQIYKNLAKKYGLEEKSYIKIVSNIPIITKKQLEKNLSFIREFIENYITNRKKILENKEYISSLDIDITERKKAEEALIASEHRFKKLVESITGYIYTVRIEDGRVIGASHGPGCVTVTGYTSEEYEADPNLWYRMIHEEDRNSVTEQVSKLLSGEKVLPLEHRIIHKDGSVRWIRNTSVLRFDELGQIIGYDGLIRDITERKRLEEILEKDKEELTQIIDSSPIVVFYKNKEGKFIRVNKTFAKDLNIPEEKIIGKTVFDFYSIKIAQSMTNDDNDVLSTKKPKHNIIEQYESVTGLRWARTDKIPIFDKKGNPIGLIGFAQDITEQKKAEESLRESEMKYRALVENSLIGIGISQHNQIIYANKSLMNMFGYDDFEEFSSRPFIEYLTPKSKAFVKEWRERRERGEEVTMEMEHEVIRKDGKIRTLRLSIMFVTLNKINYSYTAFLDITERKKAEESLIIKENTIASAISGIAIAEFGGNLTYVNPAFLKLWGYENENEVIGKPAVSFCQSEEEAGKIIKALTKNNFFVGELEAKKKDGSIFNAQITASIVKDKIDKPICMMASFLDITDRKRAVEELRESEEKFRTAFENANVGVCLVNPNGYLLKVNDIMCQIFGYSKKELEKMNVNDIAHPEDKEISPTFIKNAISGKTNETTFDKRYIHKNGHIVWGHVSSSLIRNSQGESMYFISHVQDITERKRAENELRNSEERFRKIFEESSIGMALCDSSYHFFHVNDSFCKMLSYSKDEFKNLTFKDITHPEHLSIDIEQVVKLVKGEIDVYRTEKKYIRKDKKTIWGALSLSAFLNDKGEVINVLAMIENITERKKAENDLLESEKKFRTFVETTKEWIWMIDLEGKHTYCNPAVKSILGYEPEELIGVDSFKFMHLDDVFIVKDIVSKKIEEKGGWSNLIIRWKHKDGTFRYLESNASPIIDSQGNLLGFQGAARDITERKQVEDQLLKLNEELENRVQQRTEELININKELESFSYTVSHDLRAPLRSINGFSQILLEDFKDKLDDKAQDYIKKIINSSNNLAELIDHLLNLSRITRSEIYKTKVDLSKIANEIIIELKRINPQRNIRFICKKGITVFADPSLIRSVLYNLLHNAWKYTSKHPKAKIEFGEYEKLGNRIFHVKDDGVGFDMKYSDKIFQVFQRLHPTGEYEGSGIGLATVNNIIHKHGGSAWIESEIEKGTTVYFTLGE